MKKKIIVITGPTAVGKTEISIKVAKQYNGEIISADSMQVYCGADIGTAKIRKDEMAGIEHHLIDICKPNENFSANEFVELANECIDQIIKKGKVPIIVGGTGLYISSLLYPITAKAERNDDFRAECKELIIKYGKTYLYDKLKEIDPATAQVLHPNQTDRIVRALEIYHQTGTKKSELTKTNKSPFDYLIIVITDNREVIYQRINSRVDKMIDEGLIGEVENLVRDFNLNKDNQIMQGIGYKETLEYLKGEITKEQMIDKIKQHSRNYAKRQFTWFKKLPNANFVERCDNLAINNLIEDFLRRNNG